MSPPLVTPSTPYLAPVQVGRALAALAVAAFHLSLMMGEPRYGGEAVLARWTALGKLGVDFFFVLSGFILMQVHRQDIGHPEAWRGYVRRRLLRVYPVYWVYLTGFVVLVGMGVGRWADMPTRALEWASAFTLLRFTAADPPLYVAWTLFHEVAFYAMFSLLLLHRTLGWVALAGWGLLCLSQFHYAGEVKPDAWGTYTAMPNVYFLFGMAAQWLWQRRQAGMPVLLAALALLLALPATGALASRWGPLAMACAFALLLAGACQFDRAHRIIWPRALQTLGDASYSLYLLHIPLSGLLLKGVAAASWLQGLPGLLRFALVLGATASLSVAAYRGVEAPLGRWLRHRAHPRSGKQAVAALAQQ